MPSLKGRRFFFATAADLRAGRHCLIIRCGGLHAATGALVAGELGPEALEGLQSGQRLVTIGVRSPREYDLARLGAQRSELHESCAGRLGDVLEGTRRLIWCLVRCGCAGSRKHLDHPGGRLRSLLVLGLPDQPERGTRTGRRSHSPGRHWVVLEWQTWQGSAADRHRAIRTDVVVSPDVRQYGSTLGGHSF